MGIIYRRITNNNAATHHAVQKGENDQISHQRLPFLKADNISMKNMLDLSNMLSNWNQLLQVKLHWMNLMFTVVKHLNI